MVFQREDYDSLVAERKKERINGQRVELQHLAQAEVMASALLGSPEWDYYLRLLQGAIDKSESQRDSWRNQLFDQASRTDEEIREILREALVCDVRAKAWRVALMLPTQIREDGAAAQEALNTLTGDPIEEP